MPTLPLSGQDPTGLGRLTVCRVAVVCVGDGRGEGLCDDGDAGGEAVAKPNAPGANDDWPFGEGIGGGGACVVGGAGNGWDRAGVPPETRKGMVTVAATATAAAASSALRCPRESADRPPSCALPASGS
ncbi:hypothetical protein [Streptomyces sp. NPDC048527]|uniref:hypothetical protein n=1 Tax=Streptomyces sp. NPDC048527 TaxID=3365568 RepID=UPI003711E9CD